VRDVGAELRRVEAVARVAAWLLQLAEDVAQRRLADVLTQVLRDDHASPRAPRDPTSSRSPTPRSPAIRSTSA
jgi:hypothetical protein